MSIGEPSVEEVIAHVDDVGANKPNNTVAVRVAVGQVYDVDLLVVKVDVDAVGKGHQWQAAARVVVLGKQADAHVVVRHDRARPAQQRVGAGMIAVIVGVEDQFGCVAAQLVEGVEDALA